MTDPQLLEIIARENYQHELTAYQNALEAVRTRPGDQVLRDMLGEAESALGAAWLERQWHAT